MWLTNNILREVLYKKNTVCCLCFKVTGKNGLRLYDEICLDESVVSLELSTIIDAVFGNKISVIEFLSHSVCDECAKSAISAFKFIDRCTAMNNTMMNTISNLNKITDKKKVVRGRGMYIIADPDNFQGKLFSDSRKTDTSVTFLIKRFQKFLQPELTPIKGEMENVEPPSFTIQCDACGLVLQSKSVYRHRKRCKARIDNLEHKKESDNIEENKEMCVIKAEIKPKNETINNNNLSNEYLDSDVEQCTDRNYFGDESDSWYAEEEEKKAVRRLYVSQLEKVNCEHCGTILKNKYRIPKHLLFACKGIPEYEREIFKKNYEDKKARREAFKKEVESIKANGGDVKSYKRSLSRRMCEFCGTSFTTKYNLKKHLLTLCKGLDESNRTEEYVRAVLNVNAQKPRTKRPLRVSRTVKKPKAVKPKLEHVTCSYCDQSFPSKTILSQHIYKKCKNLPLDLKFAVCSQCGKQCPSNYLTTHEKTHTDQFPCGKCGKVFKGKKGLQNHLRMPDCVNEPYAVPKPDKKYSCHVCGKLFIQKKSIDYHYLRYHTDSGGFKCKLCDKRFAREDGLKLHMVVHTKQKNFDCEICGGKFVSKHSLLYHTRTHTGEKPYKCQYCDDRFLSASRRNIHTRINHLPPQLECKYCLKKFKHWGGLNRHRKRHFMPGSSLYMPELDPPVKTKKIDSTDECESENEY